MKYLVVDTNIPLSNADNIITLGQEPDVTIVLPETVLAELDNKKSGFEEINYQARATARLLAGAEIVGTDTRPYGSRTTLKIGEQKILVIGLNAYKANPNEYGGNDQRIIETAKALMEVVSDEDEVVLMSIDYYMRLRAQAVGVKTADFKIVEDAECEFVKHMEIADEEVFRTLHDTNIYVVDIDHKPENYSYKFNCESIGQMKLATVVNGTIKVLGKETEQKLREQDCPPINSEQLLATKAIQDPMIDLVLIEGQAGSGKNVIALSNAIRLLKTNKDKYQQIVYLRNPIKDEERGEDIGYLSQPLWSKVLTPTGWTTIGDIKVGDTVSTPSGIPAKVKTLSPITKKQTYQITLKDGSVTYASGEHLWNIEYGKKKRLMTTLEIKNALNKKNYKSKNMFLPDVNTQTFINNSDKIVLDPYLVGYLIGDGILGGTHVRVAIGDNDAEESIKNLKACLVDFPEYNIVRGSSKNCVYTIRKDKKETSKGNKIKELLSSLNLNCSAYEKRIPKEYLFSSIENRQELLKGLIDSDGTIREARGFSSEVKYYTVNKQLANDVKDLVKSLGGKANIITNKINTNTTISGNSCNTTGISYYVSISGLNFIPAKLKRKVNRYKQGRPQRSKIVSIKDYKEELVRCISLDNTEHLYITDDYIVTHNSGNEEKYAVFLGPIEDTIDFIVRQKIKSKPGDKAGDLEIRVQEGIEKLKAECNIDAIITTGLRGRTFHNAIVIMDEWQNASQATAQKALTRIGKNCKVIVTGSNKQIDSKYVTKYNNGLSVLLNEARKQTVNTNINMFAIELKKVVRSEMAMFAEELFTKK